VDRHNFIIRHRTKEFKFRDNGGSDYWMETFRNIPSFPPWVQVHRKPINIGESLVTPSLQSAAKVVAASAVGTKTTSAPKPFLVAAFATPPVSAGNSPRSNPNASALESLLRGLGRESTVQESPGSLADKVAAALSESQLVDSADGEGKSGDEEEDAISENDTDYEDNAEGQQEDEDDDDDEGEEEETAKPKLNSQEEVSV